MTTGGEGGMVTTNDDLWSEMWSYKDHGKVGMLFTGVNTRWVSVGCMVALNQRKNDGNASENW